MRERSSMSAERAPAELGAGIDRRLVLLLAFTCGAAVANLYYAQPLLHTIGRAFSVSTGATGLLIAASQAGYVIGLAFLVPLGDLLERRQLISLTLVLTGVAQALAALAPSFLIFAVALTVVGVSSVVAQIIVPMASSLAAEHERGRVVGTVMSGLLIGILAARTASGVIASLFGWRSVFAFAAVAMLLLAGTIRWALPAVPTTEDLPYHRLLRSVASLVAEQPVLRLRMALGACAMGCFSVLWTSLAFLLSGPPYHYGSAVIGLFGLAGLAGAMMAQTAGRLADRGHGDLVSTGTILLLLVSWGLLALGRSSVVPLIIGIVLLDLSVQGLHISNQSAIYALHATARSRLTTAYMVAYFIGGVTLSALTAALYSTGGWTGVCILGAGTAALALAVWVAAELFAGSGEPAAEQSA
jgi:predicted MFS family arabinose efflux permease